MVIHYDLVHVQLKQQKITVTSDFEHFSPFKWNIDMKICDCSCEFFVDRIK